MSSYKTSITITITINIIIIYLNWVKWWPWWYDSLCYPFLYSSHKNNDKVYCMYIKYLYKINIYYLINYCLFFSLIYISLKYTHGNKKKWILLMTFHQGLDVFFFISSKVLCWGWFMIPLLHQKFNSNIWEFIPWGFLNFPGGLFLICSIAMRW